MTTVRGRMWREPDHYYWVTASLAARGLQTMTCRVIALLTASFGVLPVVMIFSPAGPDGNAGRTIAVGIGVCRGLLALGWLRARWPSRAQSLVYIAVSALCITLAALTKQNPVSGLTTSMSFAALVGYTVFFHTPRYVFYLATMTVPTVLFLAARLAADGDPAWAVSLLGAVWVVMLSGALACQSLVHLLGIAVLPGEIQPLTGLLNRSAFYAAAGALIAARCREDDRYLGVLIVELDNFGLLAGRPEGDRAAVAAAQTLREVVRRDAVIAHTGEAEFIIADIFAAPDPDPLAKRIRGAIKTTPPNTSASIGVVLTPLPPLADCPPEELFDELIAMATALMHDARRSGGNRARHIVCPRPAALDDGRP